MRLSTETSNDIQRRIDDLDASAKYADSRLAELTKEAEDFQAKAKRARAMADELRNLVAMHSLVVPDRCPDCGQDLAATTFICSNPNHRA